MYKFSNIWDLSRIFQFDEDFDLSDIKRIPPYRILLIES